jgi:uncharacterized YccA/Bax inhibitor family protein
MAFRTGNPALNAKTFQGLAPAEGGTTMTLSGAINKTGFLLLLVTGGAFISWHEPETFLPFLMPLAILGFVLGMVVVFKKTTAPYLAPAYALVEGLFLGAVSLHYEMRFPGIVMQAVGLTFGTLFSLLAAYRSGLIKPSENFKLGIAATTGAVALYYLVAIGASFFGVTVPFIHDSGPLGIAFSVVVVLLAAANLVLDFDFIENGVAQGAPKYMEWYAGFGLVVTLVWLYLEILRLLSKLSSRR